MSIKREFTLNINWGFEKYTYSLDFSLERHGMMKSEMFENDTKFEVPKELFKYFRKSPENLDAFNNGYFYFASPDKLNDPFDCLNNRDEILRSLSAGISEHRDNIGVCCFSLSNDNKLMWSHYTDSYKGFCLGFSNPYLIGQKFVTFQTHVSYLENYVPANHNLKEAVIGVYNFKNINDKIKDGIMRLLTYKFEYCWKSMEWEYEREYRALSIYANNFNRKAKFDKTKLRYLYIGHLLKKNDLEYYNSLIEIAKKKYRNIEVFEVRPNPMNAKLDFVSIVI